MFRANAGGVIAMMADAQSLWDASVVQLIAESVCAPRQCVSRADSAQPHYAVTTTLTVSCAFVRPATIGFAYAKPKPCYDAWLADPVLCAHVPVRSCARFAIPRSFGQPPYRYVINRRYIIRLSRIRPQTAVFRFRPYVFGVSHRFTRLSIGTFASSAIRIARSSDG